MTKEQLTERLWEQIWAALKRREFDIASVFIQLGREWKLIDYNRAITAVSEWELD